MDYLLIKLVEVFFLKQNAVDYLYLQSVHMYLSAIITRLSKR